MKEAVRTAILEAAEGVLSEQGLHARMEEIASRAGVSVGTLYNYFEDREALLDALRQNLRDELVEVLDKVTGPGAEGPFRARLERYLREMTAYLQTHWRIFALQADEAELRGAPARKRSLLKLVHQRLEELMQRGLKEGALRPGDPSLYAGVLSAMVRSLLMRTQLDQEPLSPDQVVPVLLQLFLEGAGVRK